MNMPKYIYIGQKSNEVSEINLGAAGNEGGRWKDSNQTPIKLEVVVRVVCAGAMVRHASRWETVPKRRGVSGRKVYDENDRSVGLVVEFGSFRHFMAADAGGSFGRAYADIESKLGPAMKDFLGSSNVAGQAKQPRAGHCCSMKVNHHGTKYANDASFIAVLHPKVVTVPAGFRYYFHGHPTNEALHNLDGQTSVEKVFATEIAQVGGYQPRPLTKVAIMGDTVLRPIDDTVFKSWMHDPKTSGGPAPKVQMHVYGNQVSTPTGSGASYHPRPTVGPDPSRQYPSQAFTLACDQH